MTDPNFLILYVDSPAVSAQFYADLLGQQPIDISPAFALFALASGLKLGLWSRHAVEPSATASGGGGEMAIAVADIDRVNAIHADWSKRGMAIAQIPIQMDFGYTFVALDPDGHRLRVFAPSGQ